MAFDAFYSQLPLRAHRRWLFGLGRLLTSPAPPSFTPTDLLATMNPSVLHASHDPVCALFLLQLYSLVPASTAEMTTWIAAQRAKLVTLLNEDDHFEDLAAQDPRPLSVKQRKKDTRIWLVALKVAGDPSNDLLGQPLRDRLVAFIQKEVSKARELDSLRKRL